MSILDKEMKKISKARVNILRSVEAIIYDPDRDQDSIREAATDILKNCGIMSDQIIIGADAVAESLLKDASDYEEWQHTLKDAARVTNASSRLLGDHVKTVENPEIRESIAHARGALDTTEQVALEQRRRGVIVSLNGPLAEYALHDGRMMGIIGNPEKEEVGVVIGKAEKQVVLRREDQTLVEVPVPDPSVYRRIDVGEAVSLVAHGRGDYPRLEAHLKSPDKTWHSASLYQDREGHPRGSVAIENREKGVQEKHLVVYTEKVSDKNGEKFLSAKIDREDGKQLFVTIMPQEKNGNRWLAASFAERDREKEKGHQLTPVVGKDGEMKPNAALLENVEVDRTAKYVRETFKVDPVYLHQRSVERKSNGQGLA